MLTQINTLPDTQSQAAIRYRQGHASTQQAGLDMRRHIIRPLHTMDIVSGPVRRQLPEMGFHVAPDIRVGIFVDTQRSRGVLDEKVRQSDTEFAQFGEMLQQFTGDQVKPP